MITYLITGIIVSIIYIYYSLPPSLINFLKYLFPTVVFNIKTNKNHIALTIDDAPSKYTELILDILKQNNVTATFFVIGEYIAKNDPGGRILKRIIDEGHEIGNHMMFNRMAIRLPDETLKQEIMACEKIIKQYANIQPYFRPGSGFFTKQMIKNVESLGYKMVLGNIYPHDPQIRIQGHILNYIKHRLANGSIIILHDNYEHSIQTFRKLLPMIKENGYQIMKLSDLLDKQ